MFEPETAPLADYLKTPGKHLATLDGVEYYQIDLVVARPVEGAGSRPYCLLRDWERTNVGRIAQLEYVNQMQSARIETLQREAAELVQHYRAELAKAETRVIVAQHSIGVVALESPAPVVPEPPKQPKTPKAKPALPTLPITPIPASKQPRTPATEPLACKVCGVVKPAIDFPQVTGAKVPTRLGRVCRVCHNAENRRVRAELALPIDEPGFTCLQCKSTAYTQAIRRDVCVRCARSSITSNGVSIAAAE